MSNDESYDDVDWCLTPLVAKQTSMLSSISDSDTTSSPSPGATGGVSYSGHPPMTCSENQYDPSRATFMPEVRIDTHQTTADGGKYDWNQVDPVKFEKLRSFLGKQEWACAYYDEDDGFHVEITDITEEAAREEINRLEVNIRVIFDSQANCIYEKCCKIMPGDRLKNERTGKEGIFSGTIGSCPQKIYGLTAAHAAHDDTEVENREVVKLFNNTVLSRKDIIIKEVTCSNEERVTADVRLLQLEGAIKSSNEINVLEDMHHIRTGKYRPTVYRDITGKLRGKTIAFRNHRKTLLEGLIDHCSFTNKRENLYNTITVSNIPGSLSPISAPGDSGALVWLMPPPAQENVEELCVVGIVIGRLFFREKCTAVVNNLHVVLCECKLFGTNSSNTGFYDYN